MTTTPAPEFSVEVDLGGLPRHGRDIHLEPKEAEREAIAKRLGVIALNAFSGDIHIEATRDRIAVTGTVKGELIRECVASLEEMSETVDDKFEIEFLRHDEHGQDDDDENYEAPEVHEGEKFDVGELLVQQLSLAMNPFPRKPGAKSLAEEYGAATADSPFAELRDKLEKD